MVAKRFPIEAGHIMLFARAVGETDPIYHDVEYAKASEFGQPIAPLTFVQASAQFDPEARMRPRDGVPWHGSGAQPMYDSPAIPRTGGTGLHAEQHYEYHRPLLAGTVLTPTVVPGRQWEKEGRRGGTLHFTETITEYRGEDGELIVTARNVSVRTGKVVER